MVQTLMLRQVMLLATDESNSFYIYTSDSHLQTINATYLDTAGSTSQITYGFKLFVQDNNTTTIYLNRMVSYL